MEGLEGPLAGKGGPGRWGAPWGTAPWGTSCGRRGWACLAGSSAPRKSDSQLGAAGPPP